MWIKSAVDSISDNIADILADNLGAHSTLCSEN